MKLTKAEKIALNVFLKEYEESFCGSRVGKIEGEEDAYLCRECPFYLKDGCCNLRIWRNIHYDVSKRSQ